MSFEINIDEENFGIKPKRYLKKKLDLPFYKIVKLIKDKRITLNGKKIKEEDILKEGDVIKIWIDVKFREKEKRHIDAKDLGIKTIFENNDFIVLNKPPGVIVQGAQDNNLSLSLHLAYLKKLNKDNSDFEYVHIHRLDKNTSGVLVVGKNLKSTRELNQIFKSREIIKKYICLCSGELEPDKGCIDVNLDRAEDGSKEKVIVVENGGKKTLSEYKVISKYEFKGEIFSLFEVNLKTGFMHQIRVHMKHVETPIVGDSMYGNSYINRIFEDNLNRQFLHAKSIEFEFGGEKYFFEAELDYELRSIISKMKII